MDDQQTQPEVITVKPEYKGCVHLYYRKAAQIVACHKCTNEWIDDGTVFPELFHSVYAEDAKTPQYLVKDITSDNTIHLSLPTISEP